MTENKPKSNTGVQQNESWVPTYIYLNPYLRPDCGTGTAHAFGNVVGRRNSGEQEQQGSHSWRVT